MNRRVIGVILLTVLAIGAIGAIGYGVFQAGYQIGVGSDLGSEAVRTQPVPWGGWHGPGYGPGYGFGFGLALVVKVFFLFLLFGLLGKLFFRGGPWRQGGWGGPPHHYWEQRMGEWHQQAHGAQPEGSARE